MKKNYKKILALFIIVFTVVITIQPVKAASGYSFSVGTKFSSNSANDSTDEATIANTKLKNMGYTTNLLTQPTYSTLTAKINSSRYWLESDVLYFLGHANSTTIYWNYLGKGGNYAVAINADETGYCDNTYSYIGMGMYDMHKVDLGIFMGCSTAATTLTSIINLPLYVASIGAKVTIGWSKDIPQADTYDWTNRFFTKLADGYTVEKAAAYANSFIYTSTAIKSTKIYGTSSATISSTSIPSYEVMNSSLDSYTLNKNINSSTLSEKNKIDEIAKIIQENVNVNFDSNDYVVEIIENSSGKIYDYYFTVNGIKTNVGYTVFTDVDDSKIIKVVDNMDNIKTSSLSETKTARVQRKSESLSESKIESMRKEAIESLEKVNTSKSTKTIIDEYKYYDIKADKLYYNIVVEVVDSISSTKAIEYYMEEI